MYDSSSSNYQNFLDPDQFNTQFGVPATTTQAALSWLSGAGLTVTNVDGAQNYLVASGTAAQVSAAFGTALNNYSWNGHAFYANAVAPSVPAAVAVAAVVGLNDFAQFIVVWIAPWMGVYLVDAAIRKGCYDQLAPFALRDDLSRRGRGTNWNAVLAQIVGMVADAKYFSLTENQKAAAYFPISQKTTTHTSFIVRMQPGSPDLATLDLLSQGRLVVQPTVSWHRAEYDALGVPFDARGALLDEHLAAWSILWRDSPASFEGTHHSFHDVFLEPKPFRPEGPTLWFGGSSLHERLLRRIVTYGRGFNPLGRPAPAYRAACGPARCNPTTGTAAATGLCGRRGIRLPPVLPLPAAPAARGR